MYFFVHVDLQYIYHAVRVSSKYFKTKVTHPSSWLARGIWESLERFLAYSSSIFILRGKQSFITTEPLCNLTVSMCLFGLVQHSDACEWAIRKEEMVCLVTNCVHGFHGNLKKKCDKKESWNLSRMNSAISFCICFPFSCFWSKTSNPVMQPLPWVSFLSVYKINIESTWEAHWTQQKQQLLARNIKTFNLNQPGHIQHLIY